MTNHQKIPEPIELNAEQQRAVTHPGGPMLIVAGPGSGKTRVITQRIAHLVNALDVPSENILAVTFTNKAADELKSRIVGLTPPGNSNVTASNFHKFCNRMLRISAGEINRRPDYVIYDQDDQTQMVKQAMLSVDVDPRRMDPKEILSIISRAKSSMQSPLDFERNQHAGGRPSAMYAAAVRVYPRYQQLLLDTNGMDFDDLIVNAVHLLTNSDETVRRIRNRYRHMLVDEFQDTDPVQYRLCRLITEQSRNLTVVGDPDQSIYGWRNARIENILKFRDDHPDAELFNLGENYRSTGAIIQASQNLISFNDERIDNPLTPTRHVGPSPKLVVPAHEKTEGAVAVDQLLSSVGGDARLVDRCAVLYRTNRQSRLIEEECIRRRIAYRLLGGLRFYERAEVKDTVAYLRLVHNPADVVSFQRIVNVPPRKIGAKSVDTIIATADRDMCTPMQAVDSISDGIPPAGNLTRTAREAVAGFQALHRNLQQVHAEESTTRLVEAVLADTGLGQHIQHRDNGPERWENILELLELTRQYGQAAAPDGLTALLDYIALMDKTETEEDKGRPQLTLATLHKAKGLEFPHVAIIGVEEGVLPHKNADSTQEERRLLYVGMTRAMDTLTLTYSHAGIERSRFIDEIETLEVLRSDRRMSFDGSPARRR